MADDRQRGALPSGSGLTPEERQRLVEVAREARRRAYAPYSGFRVGSAVLTQAGNLYPGCNVENASYGLAVCAERVAIFNAVVAEGPGVRIRALAVRCSGDGPCSPCGACRQVILEFGPAATVLFDGEGGMVEMTAGALLPAGFTFDAGRAGAGR